MTNGRGGAMLVLGEVHTGLLQSSVPLPPPLCEDVLGLLHGERVRRSERPISFAVSPDLLTGIDCRLATASGDKVRGVGTVTCRAAITGGQVLQGSAVAHLTRGDANRRLPWSHYLARPGIVETVGRSGDGQDLVRGFLAPHAPVRTTLDLGAISGRLMDAVQRSAPLDRRPPFRTARTRLRWAASTTDGGAARDDDPAGQAGRQIAFSVETGQLRSVALRCDQRELPLVAQLCEDLAVHDWLLTTLLDLIARSQIGGASRAGTVARLRPAIDHLLHLWMPAARVDRAVGDLWASLERWPGFSRQWHASVSRVRDQIAMCTIAALASPDRDGGSP